MRVLRALLIVTLMGVVGLLDSAPAFAQKLTPAQQLDRFAAGKPVPVVVACYGMQTKWPVEAADTRGKDWLPALQTIAASVSSKTDHPDPWSIQDVYIPYRFGSLWTLAPDRMWQLDMDLSSADMFNGTNREDLVQWLAQTLDAGQLRKAGSDGLDWRDLTRDQQSILTAIVRDPVPVRRWKGKGAGGEWVTGESPHGTGWLRNATLRLRVVFRSMGQRDANGSMLNIGSPSSSQAPVSQSMTSVDAIPGATLRYRRAVSSRLKEGDLDFASPALNAPIGLRGVTALRDAVAAAAKATRTPLRLSPEFDAMPVFIGDPALRAGDVLKCLTFGMQGAWRKVGGTYLLAWDKIGRGAVSQWELESTRSLRHALGEAKNASRKKDWGVLALDNLSPNPDDPLAPTHQQMETLAGPGHSDPVTGVFYPPHIAFADLTPRQQDAYRKEFGYSEERWQNVEFEGVKVEVTLSAPGVGESGLTSAGAPIYPGARKMAAADAAREQSADGKTTSVPADNSLILPQKMRTLAAPMLLRGEWPRLIAQMRRKGFDTLYVPVFWNGETMFPSRYFPQPPGYQGHDVLSEVVNAARPAGIKVIGVLHTLAWRNPGGSELHWMRKHREWLDVDVLGRTRREWSTSQSQPGPSDGTDWLEDPSGWADYVRPGNTEVREKLAGLVGELRHYPALDGVALDHWMRLAGAGYDYPFPMLGMAAPERAAALEKTGRDPADIEEMMSLHSDQPEMQWTPDPWDPDPTSDRKARDAFAAGIYQEDAALAADLMASLRQTWPNDVELFNPVASPIAPDDSTDVAVTIGEKRPLPEADAVISSHPVPGAPGQYHWLPAPRLSTDVAANEGRLSRATARMERLTAPPTEGQKVLSGVVLDFTTGPDLLWSCLRLLANRPIRAVNDPA